MISHSLVFFVLSLFSPELKLTQLPYETENEHIVVGLDFHLEKDWHVYWKNPGEIGFPPKVSWKLPAGWTAAPIQFPVPEKIQTQTGGTAIGYSDHVVYPVILNTNSRLDPNAQYKIKASVDYLVCNIQCLPKKADLELQLKPQGSDPKEVQELKSSLEAVPTKTASGIRTQLESENSLKVFFPGSLSITDVFVSSDQSKLKNLKIEKISNSEWKISQPEKLPRLEIVAAHASDGKIHGILEVWKPHEAAVTILWALAFAFLGGLILNLMPCVLPVVILKTTGLLKLRSSHQTEIRKSLLMTTFGILVSFAGLAAIILILKELGREVGWGFHFQSPGFVAFMIFAIFLFSLSLFGLFEFHLSATTTTKISNSKFHEHPFFQGVFATLLATPCSAPFLGTALTFAISQPAGILFLVFLVMGLGLSAPYILLMTVPESLKLLPRPGHWMDRLRRFLGYSLLIAAVWLLYVLNQQTSTLLILGILALSLGIYISLREIKSALRWILVCSLFGLGVFCAQTSEMMTQTSEKALTYSEDVLEKELNAGKKIYVVVTADWCLTCKFNENLVMKSDWFKNLLNSHQVEEMIFDWTNRDDATANFLKKYDRAGIPFSILLSKDKAIVFPEILSRSIVERKFEEFFKASKQSQP